MIQPTTKASQTTRSALKAHGRIKAAKAKSEKKQAAATERGKVGSKLRGMILERDDFRCVVCHTEGSADNPLQVDHVLPIAQGGKTAEENLATLCRACNGGKGARTGPWYVRVLRAIGHALKDLSKGV